jgi:FkbM family methyltransferase
VSNGGSFVDVGANKGLYSLFMSKYAKEVHAFEPYPPVLKRFFHFVEINGIKNVIIHPVGLGEKHERLIFQEPEGENEGRGSFVFVSPATAKHQEFEIMTGDEALEKAGVSKIDVLKMDIEGFEKSALKGLRATLVHSRPVVAFELTIDPARPILFQSMKEIENAFPANYKFLMFRDWDLYSGRYELGSVNIDFSRAATAPANIIAFPAERPVPLKGPANRF